MNDGLYLNGIWVAEVAAVLNYQANDLTKPDSLSANYSLQFNLPDSLLIRDLLENAEQIDSGGAYPYATPKAKLYEEGEVIFSGFAKLTSFKGGWKVNLIGATKDLFTSLAGKSLRDLDLSRFDHPWTNSGITSLAGATVGVVYPVVDYGNLDDNTFAGDGIYPAVYVHTLIRQMLLEENYYAVGNWLDEALIKRLAVPFVEDKPGSHDEQWVSDRSARVTVGDDQPPFLLGKSIELNPIPYTVDNQPDNNFYDGKQNNFNTVLKAYVPDVNMRLRVQAYQEIYTSFSYGAIEATLQVLVNGENRAQAYFSVSGPYNISGTKVDALTLDETINVSKGDQVTIRFTFDRRTLISNARGQMFLGPDKSWAEFVPDASIHQGDNWLVALNLPDLTCAELLKTIALMTSSTFQVDEVKRTVQLIPLDSVIARTAEAIDWSTRVDESEEPELAVALEPYAQKNLLKWKELDKVTPYGDGVINSNAANLPPVLDPMFELPFAACLDSEKSITGYGNPVLIQTRTLSGTGTEKTLTQSATTPRLILIEPSKTVVVKARRLTDENTIRDEEITLTGCWWGQRPMGISGANSFTLAFDKVAPAQREQTLILRYFQGLKRVLRRPRQLSVSVMLYPDDIATLDLTRPIRLKQVRVGSLDISDCFFYLNQIENYTAGQPCTLIVIPYF